MNETLAQLKNRKSVRVYEDRPIPADVKRAIVGAAFQAPTAGAMMLYSILDITDQRIKDRLAVICDNQPFIAKAPLCLIFLADFQRSYDAYQLTGCQPRTPGPGDLLLASADAIIAAQNTVVAAESLGVGSCYIGDIIEHCEQARELLGLPDYAVPVAMVVYGYPTQGQKDRKKPARFEEEYIVFENRYHRLALEEHVEMHRRRSEKEGRPVEDVPESIRALHKRKYSSEFALEMNRSAAEYSKKFGLGDKPLEQ